jgi:uncharacterized protein with GYD domain
MMENGWKEVFLTALDYRAHIAKDLLEEAGIKAVVLDQKDSTYLVFGEYRVYVAGEDEAAALELLKELKD